MLSCCCVQRSIRHRGRAGGGGGQRGCAVDALVTRAPGEIDRDQVRSNPCPRGCEDRARSGLFMAFQYPVAIPGVTVAKYLRMAVNAHREARGESEIKLKDFRKQTEAAMELLERIGTRRLRLRLDIYCNGHDEDPDRAQ